jgi:DNA-binding transcriptional regulator LsrR (DeoR family)
MTRQHLTDVLDMCRNTLDVDVLIHAIKKTIEIENELRERYGVQVIEVDVDEVVPEEPQEITEEDTPTSPEMMNPRSAAALREKWKRYQKEKKKVCLGKYWEE